MRNKRGNVQNIGPMVLMFGVAVIMAAVIAAVVTGVQSGIGGASCLGGNTLNATNGLYQCYNASTATGTDLTVVKTAAFNASQQGLAGMTNVSSQFPLLGTVIVFAIILSVVIGFLAVKRKDG